MNTLFQDIEETAQEKSLKIIGREKKVLTKNQILFNKLTKRIENLEKAIKSESEKLIRLLEYYSRNILASLSENANIRIKLAMAIAKSTEYNKYSKKQLDDISNVIRGLCDDSFVDIKPDAEQEAFYDKWSKTSYSEEIKEEKKGIKDMMSDFMTDMLGIDIDLDNLDFDNAESEAEYFAHLQEKIKEQYEQNKPHDSKSGRKKTKKQIDAEQIKKAEEEIKNKSIRSIYLALVKILHPDTENVPEQKAAKEEVLKKVTVAYEQKDITTLLKIEMEWVYQENEHLDNLTDDKLKIYISALKQQVAELEMEKNNLYVHPRYHAISNYSYHTEKYAMRLMNEDEKNQKNSKKDMLSLLKDLENPYHRKQILEFVEIYLEIQDKNNFKDIWDDMFENNYPPKNPFGSFSKK